MYLKSLTLKGFKSFAQPTTFAFEPGVTCVVGPNGSGKSNVVDALAWVMGEQGVKTLRGGKMEDVIFAGTSTKGPLGRAEVTLTIDNTDGALPIDYTEVTISRTLFRNGGSEYAINGQSCRLLDVQELLSDSGLGREMHVIVGQGQLDAVLRASPEDRRGFIEEAAGILKHRRRKEKTLRKLDAMQANLTRLSDLAGEIRRQLKPLGRQAEIAREAQTIAAVVRDARARLLADDVVGLRRTLDAHGRSESERHSERIVLQEQLDQKQLRLRRLEEAQIGDAVDVARRTSFGLESVQERLRGLYTLANQRLALLGSQADSVDAGPSVTPAMLADAATEIVRLTERIALAESAWAAARAATATARLELDAVDEDIAAQSALISRHDLEASKLRGQAETAASRLASVRGDVLRQQNTRSAAAGRVQEAQALLAALEAETEQANAENAGTGAAPVDSADAGAFDGNTRLSEDYESAQAVVSAAEGEVERLREELHLLERERDALAARTSALSLALDQKDGSSALLGAQLDGIRGLVAEHVRVHPGYEAAIAAALGTLADAVLADDRAAGFAALDRVRADDLGRVELILATPTAPGTDVSPADAAGGAPDRPASGGPARPSLADRAGLVWAGSVLDAPAGVLGLLENTVIAADLDAARAAVDLLTPGLAGPGREATGTTGRPLTIITKTGDVLSEFVLRGGSGAQRSKLELVADRDTAADRLGEVRSRIEQVGGDLAEQRSLLRLGKDQSAAALSALRAFDARLAAQAEKTNRATVRLEAASAELQRIAAGVLVAEQAVAGAEAEAERAKAALVTLLSRPRPILDVSVRDALHAELEAAREHEVEARLRVETARERVRSGEARAAGLARQLERDQAAAEAAARRAVIRRRQVDAATHVAEALPAVLAAVDASVSDARLRLATAEAERLSQNEELAALRREDGALRSRLQAVTESVHGLELQIYEKKLHLSGLLERAGSELGLVEEILVAEYGPDQPVPPDNDPEGAPVAYDREQQQRRHASAERRFAQLGRINPLALEEFAALEQRHKFLTEQLTDLTNTRADLLTIIDDLDVTMGAIFGSAFEDTRLAFAEVFPVLFPGGSGSIRLTDPDDLLTTGIEISVKPAGKKIERLSLLSGGERSLAAVALLIAIFKARPSPFYIMDEVEAALDDANLGRLLTIFQDLREASQLIIITHQKRTMEIADALYGVSMRQDGVSAVVGQRIVRQEEQAS
ncbi:MULTISPECIES: chromosome segregation SMC family protein [unclassified Cryobacterium]|uniref:chromosome segregation SMC family protein n=1 Tax=unclassified Cryobacterium TaxID=2649013 RepID=UPI002AB3AB89|nr:MULTISPECIES: AAA family ATPase [unclassified Cryobacterium]MDY7544290.1 AAA family ATPase [Cryobacterium sp. 5B3]MEA9999323.1 AAA family ATPase [Cryobacterium sp. RTS3]MEB0264656.1 AAA family ATPase [Cryobacterium sp. 10I5]MEB0275575.1 AAA family ATPase [Cryobacterium sp. 5B3]